MFYFYLDCQDISLKIFEYKIGRLMLKVEGKIRKVLAGVFDLYQVGNDDLIMTPTMANLTPYGVSKVTFEKLLP